MSGGLLLFRFLQEFGVSASAANESIRVVCHEVAGSAFGAAFVLPFQFVAFLFVEFPNSFRGWSFFSGCCFFCVCHGYFLAGAAAPSAVFFSFFLGSIVSWCSLFS